MNDSRRQFLIASASAGAAVLGVERGPDGSTPACHIVLIGDSIFDNGAYVPGKPNVIQQLGKEIGARGKATLLARDGDVTASIARQIEKLPADATHLVISVGGNDALQHTQLLDKPLKNSSELLAELARIHAQFGAAYATMLGKVLERGKPTAVCTIYDSNFEAPKKALADVALTVFNDVIIRCATDAGVPVIDLRKIFSDPRDYANAIEPSEIGGAKMVPAIVRVTDEHDFARKRTAFYR